MLLSRFYGYTKMNDTLLPIDLGVPVDMVISRDVGNILQVDQEVQMRQSKQKAWHILEGLMKNLIFRRHFLKETTGSAWPLPNSILLSPVSSI